MSKVPGLEFQGIISEGMTLNVGPFEDGQFQSVTVQSIKRNRAGCRLVRATQSAAIAIDIPLANLRRGMCLVDPRATNTTACQYFQVLTNQLTRLWQSLIVYFQAKICVLFHPTEIYRGFRTSVHIGNVRQTAVIEAIHPEQGIRSNDRASVVFRFIRCPEYIKVYKQGLTP